MLFCTFFFSAVCAQTIKGEMIFLDSIPAQLLLQLVLILLNAFFASTEIAILSLNAGKLRKLEEEGDKDAKRLLTLVNEPSGFLSTIQVGITLAGFLGSAFAAENFSQYLVNWIYEDLKFTAIPLGALNTIAIVIITVVLAYFTLVLGELVPKRIAMQKSMEVARFASRVVSGLSVIMKPVIWLLSASTNLILRLLRLKTEAEEETVTEDEIRMMVDLGEESGTIDADEKEWIQNVFEFGDMSVRDAMTRQSDIEALSIDATREQILATIRETGRSRFPVYGRDINDVLGILNAREYLMDLSSGQPHPFRELVRPAYFVPETIHADQLFKDMQTKKIHIAIVVDEYGETGGIITMEDLLEEIVGNIYDEFDEAEPKEIEQLEENLWRVSGSVDIETLSDELDIDLPESDDYETLGGMIFTCLHTIPKDGTMLDVEINGLSIHVERIADRRIEQALVSKMPRSDEEAAEDEEK